MYPVTQPNPKGSSITSVVKVQNISRLCLARHDKSLIMYYYDWKPLLNIMSACLFVCFFRVMHLLYSQISGFHLSIARHAKKKKKKYHKDAE